MKTGHPTLDPKILGLWLGWLRKAQHMSQEALAACSGVDVHTVQRIEAGKAVNVTSRRCLARGFGFENPVTFDDSLSLLKIVKHRQNIEICSHDRRTVHRSIRSRLPALVQRLHLPVADRRS
jgi:transcriptional regulator with XRE-family HTH domain